MNKIESYLNTTETRQKYLIYLMIFGLIFYIFVQGLMPLLDSRDALQNSVETLQLKLSRNSLGKLKRQLVQKNTELLSLKSKQDKQKEDIDFFISGLYKLKYAFYDDKEWAKSMEDILANSLKRNLKIDYIKSNDVKEPKNKDILKKKKMIEISGSGNYVDIVAFISYIDNLNTLLQFTSTRIDLANKELKFKLFIDMYGIGL